MAQASPLNSRVFQELGLKVWYARKRLAGSAKSPVFNVACEEAPDATSVFGGSQSKLKREDLIAEVRSIDSSGLANKRGKILTESGLEADTIKTGDVARVDVGKADVTEVDVTPDTARANPLSGRGDALQKDVQFVIRAYEFGNTAAFSICSPGSSAEGELALFNNIMIALERSGDPVYLGKLSWPVFSSKALQELNQEQLAPVLSRWVDNLLIHKKTTLYCFIESGMASSVGHIMSAFPASNVVTIDYSLAEMLNIPSVKALVWRRLQEVSEVPSS